MTAVPSELSRLFQSFWIAGFESACHINGRGERLDMVAATQHDVAVFEDYARLHEMGISTAREGIRWPLIERTNRFDFSSLEPFLDAARRQRVQVIWNLCHYGWPEDVDVFAPHFVDRFARFCGAVARFIADHDDAAPFYVPINEISFLSWAAGQAGLFYPYGKGLGGVIKEQLVRAAIAGIEAIWAISPQARIVHVDPVIHVIPPRDQPGLAESAGIQRESQFEAWDMLSGRIRPDLGGDPRYLDVLGVNFYHANQWEYPDTRIPWEDAPRDARWMPLHRLLVEVHERYRRPLFIAETSHFGAGRPAWIRQVAAEVREARGLGIPVEGVCIYPILDRPDWEDPEQWHNSGLWDLVREPDGALRRVLNAEYAAELRRCQVLVAEPFGVPRRRRRRETAPPPS